MSGAALDWPFITGTLSANAYDPRGEFPPDRH